MNDVERLAVAELARLARRLSTLQDRRDLAALLNLAAWLERRASDDRETV